MRMRVAVLALLGLLGGLACSDLPPEPSPSPAARPIGEAPAVPGEEEGTARAESPSRPIFDEEEFKEGVVHVRALVGFCPIGLRNVDGTGFVLDRFRGLVVTAQHVVAGTCGEIATITILADPSFRTARIIAEDSTLDLALLEVEEVRGLKDLPTSTSQEVDAEDMLCTASYVKGPQHPPLMTCGQFLGWGDCRGLP